MSKVISVCDREADIFDYLDSKLSHNERFVVRGKRLRTVEESSQDLISHLKEQTTLGCYQVDIPQKGMKNKQGKKKNRRARQANKHLAGCC